MSRKKSSEWVSGNEAAEIMSRNAGHTVSTAYVRLLANTERIRSRPRNGRENEYHKDDVEKYVVEKRSKKEETSVM